jgi:ribokinase
MMFSDVVLRRIQVILNPAPARALPDKLFKLVSILTPNKTEAELLTGIAVTDEASAAQAADKLRARGVETVILTLGAHGAFVAAASVRELVPGFRANAVDTTAAGDVFNGALAVALGEGRPLLQAARFAHAAAAISVTRLGAQPSAPDRWEIDSLLAKANTAKHASALLGGAVEDSALAQSVSRATFRPPIKFTRQGSATNQLGE